jgi:regulator of replication initiation timing
MKSVLANGASIQVLKPVLQAIATFNKRFHVIAWSASMDALHGLLSADNKLKVSSAECALSTESGVCELFVELQAKVNSNVLIHCLESQGLSSISVTTFANDGNATAGAALMRIRTQAQKSGFEHWRHGAHDRLLEQKVQDIERKTAPPAAPADHREFDEKMRAAIEASTEGLRAMGTAVDKMEDKMEHVTTKVTDIKDQMASKTDIGDLNLEMKKLTDALAHRDATIARLEEALKKEQMAVKRGQDATARVQKNHDEVMGLNERQRCVLNTLNKELRAKAVTLERLATDKTRLEAEVTRLRVFETRMATIDTERSVFLTTISGQIMQTLLGQMNQALTPISSDVQTLLTVLCNGGGASLPPAKEAAEEEEEDPTTTTATADDELGEAGTAPPPAKRRRL